MSFSSEKLAFSSTLQFRKQSMINDDVLEIGKALHNNSALHSSSITDKRLLERRRELHEVEEAFQLQTQYFSQKDNELSEKENKLVLKENQLQLQLKLFRAFIENNQQKYFSAEKRKNEETLSILKLDHEIRNLQAVLEKKEKGAHLLSIQAFKCRTYQEYIKGLLAISDDMHDCTEVVGRHEMLSKINHALLLKNESNTSREHIIKAEMQNLQRSASNQTLLQTNSLANVQRDFEAVEKQRSFLRGKLEDLLEEELKEILRFGEISLCIENLFTRCERGRLSEYNDCSEDKATNHKNLDDFSGKSFSNENNLITNETFSCCFPKASVLNQQHRNFRVPRSLFFSRSHFSDLHIYSRSESCRSLVSNISNRHNRYSNVCSISNTIHNQCSKHKKSKRDGDNINTKKCIIRTKDIKKKSSIRKSSGNVDEKEMLQIQYWRRKFAEAYARIEIIMRYIIDYKEIFDEFQKTCKRQRERLQKKVGLNIDNNEIEKVEFISARELDTVIRKVDSSSISQSRLSQKRYTFSDSASGGMVTLRNTSGSTPNKPFIL